MTTKCYSVEDQHKLRSGVWAHDREFNHQYGDWIDSWKLDKTALHQRLTALILDPHNAGIFQRDKERFVDSHFGQGTFKAYTQNKNPTEKEMGTYWIDTSSSGTSASTTTNTFITTLPQERNYNSPPRPKAKKPKAAQELSGRNLHLNVPFQRSPSKSLLEQLQADFDRWAGGCMPAAL
jgi:hypothetical protein